MYASFFEDMQHVAVKIGKDGLSWSPVWIVTAENFSDCRV